MKKDITKGLAVVFAFMMTTTAFAAPKTAEDAVLEGIRGADKTIDLSAYKLEPQKAMDTYFKVVNDNPDVFYAENSKIAVSYDKKSGKCTSIAVTYDTADIAAMKKTFDAETDKIVSAAKAKKTQYDQAVAVHDYMIKNYDFDVTGKNATAYDLVKNKKGTSTAYTGVYKATMDKLGIPCKVAISKDMGHEWNIVQIDGQWYHADISYDDPVGGSGIIYINFLKNDKMMGITGHINWTVSGGIKCTDKKYNTLA